MSYPLDIVALAASLLALYFIIRAKKTYFLDSGFFIALATIGFTVYLAQATYSDFANVPISLVLDTILTGVMGASLGIASYLLKNSDQRTPSGIQQLRKFFSKPPLHFIIFLGIVLGWTISGLALQPWTISRVQEGSSVYFYYAYSPWFIGNSALFLAAFVALPVLSFYRQSQTVHQKTASLSMKIMSLCWVFFGISLFAQIAGGEFFDPTGQSIGFVVDSLLFIMISFALREPTVLARIITAGETVSEVISSQTETDTIVLYNTESDRRRLVETFIKDGLARGQSVICHVTKAEVPFYRALLKGADLADSSDGKSTVSIRPIETGSVPAPSEPRAVTLGSRRELVDLDELGLERCRDIITNIADHSGVEQNRVGRIWALNVEGAQAGILDILTGRNPKSRVIDLANQQDSFANLIGIKHPAILGSRILLEYEPTTNYEDIVQKFVREFQANVEPIAIFTSGGSPIYRQFSEQRNIRLFSFSTKTSTPARLSDEQVLLPERDTSLLLDAVDKLLQANDGRRVGMVFEVFTYLIISLGFEKAYGVISSIVEMAESALATVLVLVNHEALEPRFLSGLRGLFQSQLRYTSEGLKTTRLEKAKQTKSANSIESDVSGEDGTRRIEV